MNHMSDVVSRRRAAPQPPLPAPQGPPLRSTKILDQLRERIRLLHYIRRTEEACVHWCRAFIRFRGIRHPLEMGGPEVEAFLNGLANDRRVAASTHKQALICLYSRVVELQLPWMTEVRRPRVQRRLPLGRTMQDQRAKARAVARAGTSRSRQTR